MLSAVQLAGAEPSSDVEATAQLGGIDADPHNGAAVFTPTAFTQPAGATTVRSRVVGLVGVTHGVGGNLEVSADAMVMPYANVAFGAKMLVYEGGRVHVAVTANVGVVEAEHTSWFVALGGVVGTYCLDVACDSVVSATVQAGAFSIGGEADEASNPLIGAVSWIQRLSPRVKLVGEVVGAVDDPSVTDELVTIATSLRVHTARFAVDAGLIQGLDWNEEGMNRADGPGPLADVGMPWLAVSARWP